MMEIIEKPLTRNDRCKFRDSFEKTLLIRSANQSVVKALKSHREKIEANLQPDLTSTSLSTKHKPKSIP